jgi:hypothetical protein
MEISGFERLLGVPLEKSNGLVLIIFGGLCGWFLALVVSSAWLSIRAGQAGRRGLLFLLLFFAGTFMSLSWGFPACSLVVHLMN